MAEWSLPDLDSPINQFDYIYAPYRPCHQGSTMQPPQPPGIQPCPMQPPPLPPPQAHPSTSRAANRAQHLQNYGNSALVPKGDTPRQIRNRAEKMRRDRLNQSVAELAAMVPPIVAARRKIDKTTVLRLTAHYLRAYQYVFGDAIAQSAQEFTTTSVLKVLNLFNGFLITVTYRGIVVVVSENVHEYLGYTELDLYGKNLLNITHEDDRALLKDQLMPRTQNLGPNGELLIPDEPDAKCKVEEALAREKRSFIIRLKKLGQRSEPPQYVTCHIQGSLRKSDKACGSQNRCCKIVRRVRARSENPCSSGNDIVFIGIVRPTSETFINESAMESYRMEYRTRHSIDGQIIQSEARIAMVTGYMTHEVSGVNAMNFMHKDDVKWVIIALREMYDKQIIYGESCYRLITKNGQFIYMRTRGRLDVNQDSGACTSFICTNSVVGEKEGKHLITLMRKKFSLVVNNQGNLAIEGIDDEIGDENGTDASKAIEDPKNLQTVILDLVIDLPSPVPDSENDKKSSCSGKGSPPIQRISIIPPDKQSIISGIGKIYDVIKTLNKDQDLNSAEENRNIQESNRRTNLGTIDQHRPSTSQKFRVIELGPSASNDPNEIFNNESESSNISLDNEVAWNESENNINSESVVAPAYSSDWNESVNNVNSGSVVNPVYSADWNESVNNVNSESVVESSLSSNWIESENHLNSESVVDAAYSSEWNESVNNVSSGSVGYPAYSSDWNESVNNVNSESVVDPAYLSNWNESENNIKSESVVDLAMSSNLGYYNNLVGGYSGMSSISENFNQQIVNSNYKNKITESQPTFHIAESQMNFFPLARLPEEANMSQILPEQSTSTYSYTSGVKRSIDFEEEATYKSKKITDDVRQSEPISGYESPNLEVFFDETLLNNQIETAINSLEVVNPELMESTDLQEILVQFVEQQSDELPDLE